MVAHDIAVAINQVARARAYVLTLIVDFKTAAKARVGILGCFGNPAPEFLDIFFELALALLGSASFVEPGGIPKLPFGLDGFPSDVVGDVFLTDIAQRHIVIRLYYQGDSPPYMDCAASNCDTKMFLENNGGSRRGARMAAGHAAVHTALQCATISIAHHLRKEAHVSAKHQPAQAIDRASNAAAILGRHAHAAADRLPFGVFVCGLHFLAHVRQHLCHGTHRRPRSSRSRGG